MEKKIITMEEFLKNGNYDIDIVIDPALVPRIYSGKYFSLIDKMIEMTKYITHTLGLSIEELKSMSVNDFLDKYTRDIEDIVYANLDVDIKYFSYASQIKSLTISSILYQIIIVKLLLNGKKVDKSIIKFGEQILERNSDFTFIFDTGFKKAMEDIFKDDIDPTIMEEYYHNIKADIIYTILPKASLEAKSNFLYFILFSIRTKIRFLKNRK